MFCEVSSGREIGIPAWMTDPACARYALGRPVIAVEALMALRELLRASGGSEDPHNRVAE